LPFSYITLPFSDWFQQETGNYELIFFSEVPAMGMVTYYLYQDSAQNENNAVAKIFTSPSTSLENSQFKIEYSVDGLINQIHMKERDLRVRKGTYLLTYLFQVSIEQSYINYQSLRRGGAYIFAPKEETRKILSTTGSVKIIKGILSSSLVVELKNIKCITTLYHDAEIGNRIETNHFINVQGEVNQEFLLQFQTNLQVLKSNFHPNHTPVE